MNKSEALQLAQDALHEHASNVANELEWSLPLVQTIATALLSAWESGEQYGYEEGRNESEDAAYNSGYENGYAEAEADYRTVESS